MEEEAEVVEEQKEWEQLETLAACCLKALAQFGVEILQ